MQAALKYSFTAFLFIGALLHVLGLFYHFNKETNASHLMHLVSYTLAMLMVLNPSKRNFVFYVIASIYPFYTHLVCALNAFNKLGKLNFICILVVLIMPLIGWWIFRIATKKF